MTEFTAQVISGELINIPKSVVQMDEYEKGDLLTLKVVKHKKADGSVVHDETAEVN